MDQGGEGEYFERQNLGGEGEYFERQNLEEGEYLERQNLGGQNVQEVAVEGQLIEIYGMEEVKVDSVQIDA